MSTDLLKRLRDALSDVTHKEFTKLIAEADAHLSSADQSREATLERENAELVEKVKRTRGSCNKLAKLLRDSERFIKDPSDKYAALAREHLLKAIDAALQPKEPNNVNA